MDRNEDWVAFKDAWPPRTSALDDSKVITTDTVLVTNNIDGRDRMGRRTHVWLAAPVGTRANPVAFTDSDRQIFGLTHWKAVI